MLSKYHMLLIVTTTQQMNMSLTLNVEYIGILSTSVDSKLILFEATTEVLQEILGDLEMDHHEALEIPQDGEIEVSLHLLAEVVEAEEPFGEDGEVIEATAFIISDQLVTVEIARLSRDTIVMYIVSYTRFITVTSSGNILKKYKKAKPQ